MYQSAIPHVHRTDIATRVLALTVFAIALVRQRRTPRPVFEIRIPQINPNAPLASEYDRWR